VLAGTTVPGYARTAMKHPYARPVCRALPDVGLPEPRVVPWVLALARAVSGVYLRTVLGFERVELRGGERLVGLFQGALKGERRLILAFRHPYGDEPQLLAWVFGRGVEKEARRLGTRLPRMSHAVFVHGYEVPRWGGAFVRWILPRSGAMPVHHSKLDSAGMARIRAAIEDGPYPLALAPEGQVSYTSDDVPRLEAGAIRLGFQSADRLDKAGRTEHVELLPISVHYRYGRRAWISLERLVQHLTTFTGCAPSTPALSPFLGPDPGGEPGAGGSHTGTELKKIGKLHVQLAAALESILGLAEHQYGITGDRARIIVGERVEAIVEAALGTAERLLGLERGAGDSIERLYRIRQAGWDRVFLPPAQDPRSASPLKRAILDRCAGEAWYAMRHMELADFAWYFRSDPPCFDAGPETGNRQENQGAGFRAWGGPPHELVEYVENLWDFANRLSGGAISGRVNVRPKRALVVVAPTLDLSAQLDGYRLDRKAATAEALAALMNAYQSCIKELRNEV